MITCMNSRLFFVHIAVLVYFLKNYYCLSNKSMRYVWKKKKRNKTETSKTG